MLAPRLQAAFDLMTRAHAGQTRKGGRPYATHPAAVQQILADEFGVADEDAQVAALLHDVVEDTPITLAEIRESFGGRVADMVDVLTKPPVAAKAIAQAAASGPPVGLQSPSEQGLPNPSSERDSGTANPHTEIGPNARHLAGQGSAEVEHPTAGGAVPDEAKVTMLRQYFAGLRAADAVVRQIKLADRVHNLREMGAGTPTFRNKYLRETQLLLDDVLAGTPGLNVLRTEYERALARFGHEFVAGASG